MSACSVLQVRYVAFNEKRNLSKIGRAVAARYAGFNRIVEATGQKSRIRILRQLAGCLLQEYPLQIGRLYAEDSIACLIAYIRPHKNEGQYLQNAKRATKVIFHRAATLESARTIVETLQYRRYYRMTHMLIYPNNAICVIRVQQSKWPKTWYNIPRSVLTLYAKYLP